MTTTIRMTPWTTVATFGSTREERQVGADQPQDEDRDDRPDDPAAAAGQADAAEHDRGDAGQQCRGRGSACRCRCSRSAPGRRAPRTGRRARRRRSSSGRPTRRCGRPPAGCCRSRRATGRAASAGAGSRSTPTTTSRTTSAFGIQSLPQRARTARCRRSGLQPVGRAAAGRVEHEQRGALPRRTTSPASRRCRARG